MEIYKKNVLYKFADIIKNKNIRKNLFNSFYYFGGTFLSFLIAIFTQPIFSRYLELEDFAVIGYFGAIQAIIYPLFSMSLPFYYMARYWNKETGEEGHKNLSFIMNFLSETFTLFLYLINIMKVSSKTGLKPDRQRRANSPCEFIVKLL